MAEKSLLKIYEKFDHEVKLMMIHAKAASLNAEVDCLYPESFIVGILNTGGNSVNVILTNVVNLGKCLKIFKQKLGERKNKKVVIFEESTSYDNMKKSKQLTEILFYADKASEEDKNSKGQINLKHIFLATLNLCPDIRGIFEKEGLNCNSVVKQVISQKSAPRKQSTKKENEEEEQQEVKPHETLEKYCTNMTELAAQNKYDPIIAREDEIESAITVLCRRNKSNPVLVGFPGTGKTAICEGICQRIVSKTVPKKLQNCRIYALNLGALVAGTKYRGEFEARIQSLIKVLTENPDYILFIDEIHTIIGTGASAGANDASNMLKPALAKNLKCIGATTISEYKKYFSGEGALERRFEKIDVEEPTKDQVRKILVGIKPRMEEYHKCKIEDAAIEATINLTARYLPAKHFPDKAIDCIDTACAKFAWKENGNDNSITANDIANVVSKQCQVPIDVILWTNAEKIRNIEQTLFSRVIGEDHAVKSICRTLKNAYSGVRNPSKPIGIFVFGGPTGTGKTYIAKELAKILFNSESSFIRIDMTEFSEPHSVSKIIGSPPGYVGHNEGDVIADKIRRKPYCVLLLDEIEKAHPDVMKLFLQVMADGTFTDAVGNKINCNNILLVMTGNFGMNEKGKGSLGFGVKGSTSDVEKEQTRLIDFCKTSYGVEFVNRVDEFIPFLNLDGDSMLKIIKLRLNEFLERISDKNMNIVFSDGAVDELLKRSKEEHGMNATIINRLISKYIEPVVADALENELENEKDTSVIIDFKDNGFVVK